MRITTIFRNGSRCKIFCADHWLFRIFWTNIRKSFLAGFDTDLRFFNIFIGRKTFHFLFLFADNAIHNLFPDYFMVIFIIIKRSVIVITCPDRCRVVWRISAEPVVIVVRSSTCFGGNGHIWIKLRSPAGSFFNNILHRICKKPGGWFLYYFARFLFVT